MFMRKSYIRHGLKCLKQLFLFSLSLHQDVTHGFDVFVSIIRWIWSFVSARVEDIMFQSSIKPDSGVTSWAVIFLISNDTNACSRMGTIEQGIEPFLVAVVLQGGLWTNQLLPLVTTQCGVVVLPSAISEYSELACLLMTMKLICWPIFIPRQILEKDVFQ